MTEAQTDTRGALTTHAARPLLILAADHRNSLERDLYGLTAAPTPEQAARTGGAISLAMPVEATANQPR